MRPAAEIAREVLAARDGKRLVEPLSTREPGLDAAGAQAIARELAHLRIGRGQRRVGRKIGFTNRSIWSEYGVWRPIWGDMWDTTVRDVSAPATIPIAHLPQPRIEPEIVLGLDGDLSPGMDAAAIAKRIGWVAHGFEIVQSVFPDWRFTAADCIADGGLHGMLLVGPRHEVPATARAGLAEMLSSVNVTLRKDGQEQDRGTGGNALDGPVEALAHLVATLAEDLAETPVRAGDMVTTGTLTRAFPIEPGERWTTEVDGAGLAGLDVTFS